MIRWYDYLVALFLADTILSTFIFATFSDAPIYGKFFASLAVYFLYDLWTDGYCKWRLGQERRRGK